MKDKFIHTANYGSAGRYDPLKNNPSIPLIKTSAGRTYTFLGETTKYYTPLGRIKMTFKALWETIYTVGFGPFFSKSIQDHWMAALTGKRKIAVYTDDANTIKDSVDVIEAARKGDILAAKSLSHAHEMADIYEPEKSFKYLKLAADNGDAEAQYKVGERYLLAIQVKKDPVMAYKYFISSADNGYDEAKIRAAIAYEEGIGVEEDYNKAFSYLDNIKDRKLRTESLLGMGRLIETGKISNKIPEDALPYFEEAAESGDAVASHYLGLLYSEGQYKSLAYQNIDANKDECFKKNYERARSYLDLAVKQGYVQAITALGWLATNEKDYKLAEKKFIEAVNAGDKEAYYWHGKLYLDDRIKSENARSKGIELLKKAADSNFHPACYDLAIIFLGDANPLTKEESKKTGLVYMQKAADLGNTLAKDLLKKAEG